MCMCVSHIFLLVVASSNVAFHSLYCIVFVSLLPFCLSFQRTSTSLHTSRRRLNASRARIIIRELVTLLHAYAYARSSPTFPSIFLSSPVLRARQKFPPPPKKKKKRSHYTHVHVHQPRCTPIAAVRSHQREIKLSSFPKSRRWGEENLKLPTVVPFATPRRPFCHGNNFRPRIIKRLCGANFTSERSRRTNDENTRCGRDRTFPPTRGTTSRVPSSFPKRDLNFTNAAVCRVRPRRTSRCGRGANSPDPSEPNNTEEAYGEPAEILSKLTHSLSLSLGDCFDTVVIYDGVTACKYRHRKRKGRIASRSTRSLGISVQEFKSRAITVPFLFPPPFRFFFSRFSFFKNC